MSVQSELDLLIRLSRDYYTRMWMFATAGNLSIFDRKKKEIWITASGKNKSSLSKKDFISIHSESGKVGLKSGKPSAETSIHKVIYENFENVNAVLHVHTPASCLLNCGVSREKPTRQFLLPNIEIIKAFGDFRENPDLKMTVVYNFGIVSDISDAFRNTLRGTASVVPFFLIQDHGVTAWGRDVSDANKNLEAAEFILQVMASRH
ncbi:MAG: methylthioribulose 1-phosphate dehydratase [Leptospira sp.]|nr:methylthioribulose 1-phosphate dehydratase [Leptospira sp.]